MMPSFLHRGAEPRADRLHPVVTDWGMVVKPKVGGLWTCREEVTGFSEWDHWCENNEFRWPPSPRHHLWRLSLDHEPALLVIASERDLERAYARFPNDAMNHGRYPMRGLDYAALAREYDGLELTEDGLYATREMLRWKTGEWVTLHTNGYDVPTVLFFKWMAFTIEEVSV